MRYLAWECTPQAWTGSTDMERWSGGVWHPFGGAKDMILHSFPFSSFIMDPTGGMGESRVKIMTQVLWMLW